MPRLRPATAADVDALMDADAYTSQLS